MSVGSEGPVVCAECGEDWPVFLIDAFDLPGCPACEPAWGRIASGEHEPQHEHGPEPADAGEPEPEHADGSPDRSRPSL